jgi:hypothetical protein
MKYYYADAENKTVGPVALETLQELIKLGAVKHDPMIVAEGGSEWRPLSTVPPQPETHTLGGAPGMAGGSVPANAAIDKAVAASKDALAAFKMFATNPVGGLAGAFDTLGHSRAMGVGIAFGLVGVLSSLLAVSRVIRTDFPFLPSGFDTYFKLFLIAIVPFACLLGSNAALRKIFKLGGGLGHDCFTAGAALLPLTALALTLFVIGSNDTSMVMAIVGVFAACLTVLMLFTGLTKIQKLTDRAATFLVPITILLTGMAVAFTAKTLFNL